MKITNGQKVVALGAVSGVVLMALFVYGMYQRLPNIPQSGSIAFVLQMNLIAAMPLFLMIAMVGNARFRSEAIDPTVHAESRAMEIDGRVVENTLEQNFLFLVATLALATVLPIGAGKIFVALTAAFVVARLAFWIGYRRNPLLRAPGMAATSYMNLGIILYVLYQLGTIYL